MIKAPAAAPMMPNGAAILLAAPVETASAAEPVAEDEAVTPAGRVGLSLDAASPVGVASEPDAVPVGVAECLPREELDEL